MAQIVKKAYNELDKYGRDNGNLSGNKSNMTTSRIDPSEVETMVLPAPLYIVATRKTGYVSAYENGSVCGLDKGRFCQ
jgi:hypothetical protein